MNYYIVYSHVLAGTYSFHLSYRQSKLNYLSRDLSCIFHIACIAFAGHLCVWFECQEDGGAMLRNSHFVALSSLTSAKTILCTSSKTANLPRQL